MQNGRSTQADRMCLITAGSFFCPNPRGAMAIAVKSRARTEFIDIKPMAKKSTSTITPEEVTNIHDGFEMILGL